VYNQASYLYNFRLGLMLAMKKKGWEVIAASPYDESAEKIKTQGIRFQNIPLSRKGKNPFTDFRTIFSLTRFYLKEKPNVVHHFTIKPVIYGTAAARLAGVAGIVNLIPGLGYVFLKGGAIKHLVKKMYRFALSSRVQMIFQNQDDLNFFHQNKLVDLQQTHVICGAGVNTTHYSTDQFPSPSPSSQITFLLVSRMLWDKGIAEFVDAAYIVKEKNPATHFMLLGNPDDGNPAAVPASWLEEQNSRDHIEWIRHQEDVRPFLARADVIVLPSYREGASRALMEAAAMSKPIITTDVPGCRDIVENQRNGILVPPNNVSSLAQAMLELAADPQKRIRMGLAGQEKALFNFSETTIIQQTLEIYHLL